MQHFFAVERLSTYSIEFKGLKEGNHEFDYQIGKSFFDNFDNSLVDEGDIQVKIVLEKHSSFFELHFNLSGMVLLTCDRCLEPYKQKLKGNASMFIKFGDSQYEEGEDVVWLHPDEHQINVAKLIYENIVVNIPLRHVHPSKKGGEEGCDPEMLRKLKEYSRHQAETTDERWNTLKKLLNNN